MIVIADVKRGDIGTTAKAYSNAFLGQTSIGDIKTSIYNVDFIMYKKRLLRHKATKVLPSKN